MALENGFRVICDVRDFCNDIRSKLMIYIDLSKDHVIGDLSARIKTLLRLQSSANILLLVKECLLPETENVRILHQEDVLRVVNNDKALSLLDYQEKNNVEPSKEKYRKKQKRKGVSEIVECLQDESQVVVNQSVVNSNGIGYYPGAMASVYNNSKLLERVEENSLEFTKEKYKDKKKKRREKCSEIVECLGLQDESRVVDQSVTKDVNISEIGNYPEAMASVYNNSKLLEHVEENSLELNEEKYKKKKKRKKCLDVVECLKGEAVVDHSVIEDAVSERKVYYSQITRANAHDDDKLYHCAEENTSEPGKENRKKKKKAKAELEETVFTEEKNKAVVDQNVIQDSTSKENSTLVAHSQRDNPPYVHQSEITKDNNKQLDFYFPIGLVNHDSTLQMHQCPNKLGMSNGKSYYHPTSVACDLNVSKLPTNHSVFEKEVISEKVCITPVTDVSLVKPTSSCIDKDENTPEDPTPRIRRRRVRTRQRRKNKNKVNNFTDNTVTNVKTETSVPLHFYCSKSVSILNGMSVAKHIRFSDNSDSENEISNPTTKVQDDRTIAVPSVSLTDPCTSTSSNVVEPVVTQCDTKKSVTVPSTTDSGNLIKAKAIFSKSLALANHKTPLVVKHVNSANGLQENESPVVSNASVIECGVQTSTNIDVSMQPGATRCDTRNSIKKSPSANTNHTVNSSNQEGVFGKLLALANHSAPLVVKHVKPFTPEPKENAFPATTVPFKGSPKSGDVLTFKILRLDENYCPQVSEPITAEVIEYLHGTNVIHVNILAGADQCQQPSGKFDIEMDDDELEKEPPSMMMFNWNDVLEPQWNVK